MNEMNPKQHGQNWFGIRSRRFFRNTKASGTKNGCIDTGYSCVGVHSNFRLYCCYHLFLHDLNPTNGRQNNNQLTNNNMYVN